MVGIPLIEWVGYAASILVAISLFMKEIIKLRVINIFGCILFVIYGFSVKAYPVGVINSIIIFINLYYLYKLNKETHTNFRS